MAKKHDCLHPADEMCLRGQSTRTDRQAFMQALAHGQRGLLPSVLRPPAFFFSRFIVRQMQSVRLALLKLGFSSASWQQS
jgi:hypothetical protein